MYIVYIIFAILMFSFLIATHELGHFIAAKLCGVKVNEFSIFMGPAIWKKQKGETLYAIRTIPFGGYCAMEGEGEESSDPRSFGLAKWWKKIIILVAGAGTNFVTGFLITVLLVACVVNSPYVVTPVISDFTPGNVVEGPNGLRAGDELYSVDGERILVTSDFTMLTSLNLRGEGYTHDLVVIRDGEKVLLDDFNLEPRMLPDGNGGESLRYGLNLSVEENSLGRQLSESWNTTLGYVRSVRLSISMLIRGQASVSEVSGPVGIVKTIADVGSESDSVWSGFANVLSLAALIAVNLAVMNLLPIPALDGGHILSVLIISAIEGITRKKLDPKYELFVHSAGMVLLLLLMAAIFLKDIIQLFF